MKISRMTLLKITLILAVIGTMVFLSIQWASYELPPLPQIKQVKK